ncbi:PepSY domain-containing protein [Aquipuribacter hungaricus]|uniref:PepSY domain-containing protein n=1 Tax=Aquipuribacter hungaricus TaxID=545624 RepID=A0ABV7WNV6_9MICO
MSITRRTSPRWAGTVRPDGAGRRSAAVLLSGMLAVAAGGCGSTDSDDGSGFDDVDTGAAVAQDTSGPSDPAGSFPSPTSSGTSSQTPSGTPSASGTAPTATGSGGAGVRGGGPVETQAALAAVTAAQGAVQDGRVFDLEDEVEGGQRLWKARVASPDGRQFTLDIAQDGSSVLSNDEDPTPDDDVAKLQGAQVGLEDAVATAAGQAQGAGDLTAVEIDTIDRDTVVWQVDFGDDDGTTVLVDAATGAVVATGPDVG